MQPLSATPRTNCLTSLAEEFSARPTMSWTGMLEHPGLLRRTATLETVSACVAAPPCARGSLLRALARHALLHDRHLRDHGGVVGVSRSNTAATRVPRSGWGAARGSSAIRLREDARKYEGVAFWVVGVLD